MRERLTAALNEAVDCSLTLVSAPPGYGKTVLAASWAAENPRVAWVALDADDDSPPRFWSLVAQALAAAGTTVDDQEAWAEHPLDVLGSLDSDDGAPVVLVLDDFQELHSPTIFRQLETVLRHGQSRVRLVLLTRVDPALPLQRLRLGDDLVELRAAELAFTPDEVRLLFEAAGIDAPPDELTRFWRRTEGWPAAAQFAALAIGEGRDPAGFLADFAGDDRAVSDYLLTEVLSAQEEETRAFLLRTSVPERLTRDLAVDLTGTQDAGDILDRLERESLFVSRLEGPNGAYRYHPLFREFLLSELSRAHPDERLELHRRTSLWYAENGGLLPALRHAVAGGDWAGASRLVAHEWRTLVFGNAAEPTRPLVDAVPDHALRAHAPLALLAAASLYERGESAECVRCVEVAADALDAVPAESRADVESFLAALHAAVARVDADAEALRTGAQELLELQPTDRLGSEQPRRRQRALGLAFLGVAETWLGRIDDADEHLEQAVDVAETVRSDAPRLLALSYLALLELLRGRLRRAATLADEALLFAETRGASQTPSVAAAHLAAGWSLYHWDDLVGAAEHLDEALVLSRGRDPVVRTAAGVVRALAYAGEGAQGADRGLRLVRGLRTETRSERLPPYIAAMLASAEPRLLAARGDVDAARRALERTPAGAEIQYAILRARMQLLDGNGWDAIETLQPVLDELRPDEPTATGIEAWLLEGLGRSAVRDRDGTHRSLERSLALAAPHAYRRIFVEAGPAARAALIEHVRRGTAHRAFVAEVAAAFERRAPDVELTRPQLLEPLSERELAVLAYLPTMMSNVEIASELFVSVNTIKTHLRSIYRKLGATRRRDAVEMARKLELI